MPRPGAWEQLPYVAGQGPQWKEKRGYIVTRTGKESIYAGAWATPRYHWVMADPSGEWVTVYPHEQHGQNVKRIFPKGWANKQILAFEANRSMGKGGEGLPRVFPDRGWRKLEQKVT